MANILIVEDEVIVRQLLASILRSNHTVSQAGTVEEADVIFRKLPVDLIILNVNLHSTKSGPEFAAEARQHTPQLRLLFISGYPFDDWSDRDRQILRAMPERLYSILEKPFTPGAVQESVTELLSRPETLTA